MKRVLFFSLSVVTVPLAILASALSALGDGISNALRSFEDWALEYTKNGWIHLGDGIWKLKDKE